MRILVVGSGGREHAIVNRLVQEKNSVYATGSNAGIIAEIGSANCINVNTTSPDEILDLAKKLEIDLVVIGPEAPLVAGVADLLRENGILVFGPNRAAAQIEASKAFAKTLMIDLGIPTAQAITCQNIDDVLSAITKSGAPYVVKDDGLAAGKGVVVTDNQAEALSHAQLCLLAGNKVVVEEFLSGEEVSVLCVTDGKTVYPLVAAQDHKRIYNGDLGPNTGGMGAYAPVSWFTKIMQEQVIAEIAEPIVNKLSELGNPFIGVLYCGLINTLQGLKVIEFNARFGDPEAQVVIPLMKSSLTELLYAAANGNLAQIERPEFSGSAVTVVLASAGYPATSSIGDEISLKISHTPQVHVFHSGTKLDNGAVKTAGGRVLAITALAESINQARNLAYQAVAEIDFSGRQYRTDIGLGK
jgi:phosphoribosylamine--glycine ligase